MSKKKTEPTRPSYPQFETEFRNDLRALRAQTGDPTVVALEADLRLTRALAQALLEHVSTNPEIHDAILDRARAIAFGGLVRTAREVS